MNSLSQSTDLDLLVSIFGAHSNNAIQGRTRIQKLVCVLKYQDHISTDFKFKSHFYGPFSEDLAESVDRLVGMKVLDERVMQIGYDTYRYDYQLTPQGQRIFERIRQKLDAENPSNFRRISEAVDRLEDTSLNDLIDLAKSVSHMHSTRM